MLSGKHLLSARETAEFLFGKNDDASYQKTLRILRSGQIPTIKSGKVFFVARAELEKLGVASLPSGGTVVRPDFGSASNPSDDS
tara:strand:+ start:606 stop:857 length:252 start_codon:yes stop_codon:yes gene_type:complete